MAASTDRVLQTCLAEMGLPSLIDNFVKEHIDAGMIESLSDEELSRLGVSTIGQRHKLKQILKTKLETTVVPESRTSERNALFRPRRPMVGTRNNTVKRRKSVAGVTMHFICVASKNQTVIPNSTEKEILNRAGLGKKSIRFNKTDTEKDVFEKLMSDAINELGEVTGFPKLIGAGGIELLRSTQNCRQLKLIDCPSWSAKELQKNVNPQTTIYIRPIQNDLSVTPENFERQTNDESQLQKCNGCQEEFRLKDLRKHTENCSAAHNTCVINENLPVSETNSTPDGPETLETVVVLEEVFAGPAFDINSNETNNMNNVDLQDILLGNEDEAQTEKQSILENVSRITDKIVYYCTYNNISDPIEILRKAQMDLVRGRALEISDVSRCEEGDTNFILVDRANLLETGFDEIGAITDLQKTLEVQFYEENAVDYGGPRKEFFCIILAKIKEKYFDNGLRQLLSEDYEIVGKIFALSILQNGKIPTFLGPDILQKLFSTDEVDQCITKLRNGLDSLGIYTIGTKLPSFVYLFQRNVTPLTFRMLTAMLTPQFSPEGSNNNMLEKKVYSAFLRYLREVASGRREYINVGKMLQFVTGTEEEPAVGFTMKPTIQFVETDDSFIPTANTCINCLRLPRPSSAVPLPEDPELFRMFDYAFVNSYYGLH